MRRIDNFDKILEKYIEGITDIEQNLERYRFSWIYQVKREDDRLKLAQKDLVSRIRVDDNYYQIIIHFDFIGGKDKLYLVSIPEFEGIVYYDGDYFYSVEQGELEELAKKLGIFVGVYPYAVYVFIPKKPVIMPMCWRSICSNCEMYPLAVFIPEQVFSDLPSDLKVAILESSVQHGDFYLIALNSISLLKKIKEQGIRIKYPPKLPNDQFISEHYMTLSERFSMYEKLKQSIMNKILRTFNRFKVLALLFKSNKITLYDFRIRHLNNIRQWLSCTFFLIRSISDIEKIFYYLDIVFLDEKEKELLNNALNTIRELRKIFEPYISDVSDLYKTALIKLLESKGLTQYIDSEYGVRISEKDSYYYIKIKLRQEPPDNVIKTLEGLGFHKQKGLIYAIYDTKIKVSLKNLGDKIEETLSRLV